MDIAQIFATDPLKLTKEDISSIVCEMRKRRASFVLGSVTAGKVKAPTEKQKAVSALAAKLIPGGLDL
jgi:hypothetical protein